MEWVVIQLTGWAEKKASTEQLKKEIRDRTKRPNLEILYAVNEDAKGKNIGVYSEYIFVEYFPGFPILEFHQKEWFKTVLLNPKGEPEILTLDEIKRVWGSYQEEIKIKEGKRVKILKGALKGSTALVERIEEELERVELKVRVGEEEIGTVLPICWVRRLKDKPTSNN